MIFLRDRNDALNHFEAAGATAMNEATRKDMALGDWLAAIVEQFSDPAERARMAPLFGDKWALRLCFAGKDKPGKSWAEVGYRVGGHFVVVRAFGSGTRVHDRLERVTELPFSMMFVLGELLEDTKAHQAVAEVRERRGRP
jgi:hypothetical protein